MLMLWGLQEEHQKNMSADAPENTEVTITLIQLLY